MTRRLHVGSLVLILIGRSVLAHAQSGPVVQAMGARAQAGPEVRGAIRDQSGGVIAGATVVVTGSNGETQSTTTNWQGRYRLVWGTRGTATVRVEAPGFAPSSESISMASSDVALDFTLRLAASTRVDVHGGLTGVSLDSGQNMSTITLSGRNLDLLPNDPEGLLYTLRMLAGTTGTRADEVKFYIDGMPIDRRLPPKDVILTVRINANPFSAEFSEAGPSRVDIITKPASNQFHGEGRLEFNDSRLNASTPFEPVKPEAQYRTFTGYVGGPIQKDRWGFLLFGGGWQLDESALVDANAIDQSTRQPVPVRLNVPTPTRTSSLSVKTNGLLASGHIVALEYGHDRQRASRMGLQSGFDLPERAYLSTSQEHTASARLTSTVAARFFNEFRVQMSHLDTLDRAESNDPALIVLESFYGGGNQDQLRDNGTRTLTLANASSLLVGQHSLRFGGQIETADVVQVDRWNYNGTFTFGNDVARDALGNPVLDGRGESVAISSLELYRQTILGTPGVRPSQFSIVRGDPAIAFPIVSRAVFVQDDWRLRPRMTMSLGVRAESQRELLDHRVIAPRAGVAWAPSDDGRSALRGGFGLFYAPVPPTVISDVRRSRQSETFVVNRPSFFPAIPTTLSGAQVEMTTRTEAPQLSMPWAALATVSYDRQISAQIFGSIGYTLKRGGDLLRTRVVRQTVAGPTLQFESTGRSTAHELHLTANGSVGSWLNLFSSYSLTRAYQDTDGPYSLPANSSNTAGEWGRALVPVHAAAAGASFMFLEDFSITPFVRVSSSLPFTITTGMDNNGDTQFADRPALTDESNPRAIVTPYGVFDPNPGPGQAIIPRNSANGPSEITLDVTASWLVEGLRTGTDKGTMTIEVTNLTNRINYAPYNGVLTSPFFGTANRALNPRRVVLTLRYDF